MLVTAHRGYSGLYPENTMLAFSKAVEAGADEIEMDVQLCKDGTIVIIHDESVDRVTGVKGLVRDFNFAELRKLNASAGIYGEKYGITPIPSLEEYFSWVKGKDVVTNIELKNGLYYYEGLEEKTIELIRKYGLEKKVLFSSFNHLALINCKKLCPSIPCGALTAKHLGRAGYYAKSNGLDFYHPDLNCLYSETAEECRKNGIGINVWTVNDMAGLQKAETLGCRSVITDFPDICKAWLSR